MENANLYVKAVDTAEEIEEPFKALWEAQESPSLPWITVCYPQRSERLFPIWAAPLTKENLDAILASPVRKAIAERILGGEAAIWLILECGDSAKNDAAEKKLEQTLAGMPAKLVEAAATEGPRVQSLVKTASFFMARVSRDDALERVTVSMLLNSEPDLSSYDEPMAFPVYGRGRALYALVGAGITPDNIFEACHFLVTGCSCLIKADNPGTDLLIKADWTKRNDVPPFQEIALDPLPADSASTDSLPREPDPLAQYPLPARSLLIAIVAGLVLALTIIVVLTLVLLRRRQSR